MPSKPSTTKSAWSCGLINRSMTRLSRSCPEGDSDTPSVSILEDVFSDDYLYDTYEESMESSDNDEK